MKAKPRGLGDFASRAHPEFGPSPFLFGGHSRGKRSSFMLEKKHAYELLREMKDLTVSRQYDRALIALSELLKVDPDNRQAEEWGEWLRWTARRRDHVDLQRREHVAAERLGIDFFVLGVLGAASYLEGCRALRGVVRHAIQLEQSGAEQEFHALGFCQRAGRECLSRGLLEEVTPELLERMRDASQHYPNPGWLECAKVGGVILTDKGLRLLHAVYDAVMPLWDSYTRLNMWAEPNVGIGYSHSAETGVADVLQGIRDYDECAEILEVEGPTGIGRWMPCWPEVSESGYRVRVRYRVPDEHVDESSQSPR